MTTTYMVPFEAEEIVWNSCVAKVKAASKEEAFAMVEQSIEESNPFRDFNADWNGINTVTSEVIQTTKYCIGDDYNLSVEDVKEVNELEVELTFSAFDLLRLEKDAIYHAVEQQLDGVEVLDMEMIPTKISGSDITYRCIPTNFIVE